MNVAPIQPSMDAQIIAPASVTDIPSISKLTHEAVPDCVPMSVDEIESHLDEFDVVRHDRVTVIGAVSVRELDETNAEIRGLTVARHWRGHGLGELLVRRAIIRALISNRNLLCVTRQQEFFTKLGFREVPMELIPEKPRPKCNDPTAAPRVAMSFLDLSPTDGGH